MKRRRFLEAVVLSGTTLLATSPAKLFSQPAKTAADVVRLGKTGIETSRLAVGTGSDGWGGSSNQTRQLGIKGLADLLHAAYDEGIRFWDSADQYGTHPHLQEGLKRVPREKIAILTKTHASSEAAMRKDLDRFRREIGTDYIDIILLHCMTAGDWPEIKKGAMEALSRAREEGIIRAHGVSCHTMSALRAAAASDWVQIDLARINPYGTRMDGNPQEVIPLLKKMKNDGKSVMGMKILGNGALAGKLDECLRFAVNQDYIDSFTIGFESEAQLKETIRRIRANG